MDNQANGPGPAVSSGPQFKAGQVVAINYFINGHGKLCMLRLKERESVIFDRPADFDDIYEREHSYMTDVRSPGGCLITIHHDKMIPAWPGSDRGVWVHVIIPPRRAWRKSQHVFVEGSVWEGLHHTHGRWVRIEQLESDWADTP